MSEAHRAFLRLLLIADYADLSQRLAQRLGTLKSAKEVLQDTYARLQTAVDIGPVHSPRAVSYTHLTLPTIYSV